MKQTDKDKANRPQDPMSKTLSVNRMRTLIKLDEFLTQRGRDDEPATIAEICAMLGVKDKNHERGVRKNLEALWDLSESRESSFRIVKKSSDSRLKFMIEPGHSLFRRDLNESERHLVNDLFQTLGNFKLPKFSQIEDLVKEAGVPDKRKIVDFGVKTPANRSIFSQLFDAIASRRVIRLFYLPMHMIESEENPSQIMFCPWQLKVFGDRWSLVGMDASDGYILKFYLDQISKIEVQGETYDEDEMKRMDPLFKNTVGMSTPRHLCEKDPDPVNVVESQDVYFWADSRLRQSLLSFPIHENMDMLDPESETSLVLRAKYPGIPEGGSFFWMNVYVTEPLKQALAGHLDRLLVLEPESLRQQFQNRVSRLHTLYSDVLRQEN